MNKRDAIQIIESTYPPDSPYPKTNKIGAELLSQAQNQCGFDWRSLPDNVIVRYAELCLTEDYANTQRFMEATK